MKKILFIAPVSFGFYDVIARELQNKGCDVFFINENFFPNTSWIGRAICKLPNFVVVFLHYLYIRFRINGIKEKSFDKVVFIRGYYFSSRTIDLLKKTFITSEFIMYQWDFETNLPLLKQQIPYFDRVYSFDKKDCLKFGFLHKPLFYHSSHVVYSNVKPKYKFNFVGTDHSDRYNLLCHFIKDNELNEGNCFFHLYRSRVSFVLALLRRRIKLGDSYLSLYSFNRSSAEETIMSMSNSEIILDITQPGQNGLTMRTFEALGLKRKLVTTNADVVNYDFYHACNIYIIDRDNLVVPKSFLDAKYFELPVEVYSKYDVGHWVKDFLLEN